MIKREKHVYFNVNIVIRTLLGANSQFLKCSRPDRASEKYSAT
jgi:hypothetical protein